MGLFIRVEWFFEAVQLRHPLLGVIQSGSERCKGYIGIGSQGGVPPCTAEWLPKIQPTPAL
jgi:hypothetical protein